MYRNKEVIRWLPFFLLNCIDYSIIEYMLKNKLFLLIIPFLLLSSCNKASDKLTAKAKINDIDVLGDVILDINPTQLIEYNMVPGDSINVSFSGGTIFENIPYYNDFYGSLGDTMLVAHNDILKIGGQYYNFVELFSIGQNETVTITLHEKEGYKALMDLYYLDFSKDRSSYPSDEVFANFRALNKGKLKDNLVFKSATPVNSKYGRVGYVDDLIGKHQIKSILNLCDNRKSFMRYKDIRKNVRKILLNQNLIFGGTDVNFYSENFRNKLTMSFKLLMNKEGPFLIHCSLGRDRTGFVCALLEALAETPYSEIVDDYMLSFKILIF